ncbi:MAG TPA: hypothetical protein PLA68_04130, partial [Panacibacter sp.]|nr:hypothetical protein [Panacibacter sp.]
EQNWTEREIYKFEALTEKKLINISNHPKLGSARNKKYPNIRFTLVHKRVALIYRHKPHKEEIELLVFWNTLQNPRKLKMKIDGI